MTEIQRHIRIAKKCSETEYCWVLNKVVWGEENLIKEAF